MKWLKRPPDLTDNRTDSAQHRRYRPSEDLKEQENNPDLIKVCPNCKSNYIEGDKYCRFCGSPLGEPAYVISERFACIYGPRPAKRVHTCMSCRYSWETRLMRDSQTHCPKCGGRAPVTSMTDEY